MKTLLLLLMSVLINVTAFTQTIPELVFQNPVLTSGVAGQDGAKYRFSNVGPNLDAELEIKGRSAGNVVINTIDRSNAGWNKALQPEVGINGTVAALQNWWIELRVTFYVAGTNDKKKITKFFATSLDVDGDGQSIKEWIEVKKIKNVTFSATNNLTSTLLGIFPDGQDRKIAGPITNYVSIDTSATNVMATYEYEDKDKIEFKIGGSTGVSTSTAGMRLNSIWFKEFNLTPPVVLPVKLTSFIAMLNNNNKVDLKWTTATETNLSHFVVERSTDGVNYSDAGMVFAYGNTTAKSDYALADNISNVQSGIIYYRLRSVDVDGKTQYSDVRIIRISKQAEGNITIATYPNPATSEVRITIPANWQNKKVVYEVFSANGQAAKKMETASSGQTETLNVSNLNSGLYIVKVTCEGQTAQQKIVKQ